MAMLNTHPLQGAGMGLNTWESPDNIITWIWECFGVCFRGTKSQACYHKKTTVGKQAPGTDFQKVAEWRAMQLLLLPLHLFGEAGRGFSASAPSASVPISIPPSALSASLHLPHQHLSPSAFSASAASAFSHLHLPSAPSAPSPMPPTCISQYASSPPAPFAFPHLLHL